MMSASAPAMVSVASVRRNVVRCLLDDALRVALKQCGGVVEPRAERLSVQNLLARPRPSEPAVRDEGDQPVVEAVEREHLLPNLAHPRRQLRVVPGERPDLPQILQHTATSDEVRTEALPVRREHVSADARLLALHLEENVARGGAERQRELEVVIVGRAVEVERRDHAGEEHRDEQREQDEKRDLNALLDRRRTARREDPQAAQAPVERRRRRRPRPHGAISRHRNPRRS
jgi:hypothetical protein